MNENKRLWEGIKKNIQRVSVIATPNNHRGGEVRDLPTNSTLKEGDTLAAGGIFCLFPAGLVVGTVIAYHKSENEGLSTATLKYGTPFGQLHYVYILKNLKKKEQLQLIKEAAQ